jgi:hypothetical protein
MPPGRTRESAVDLSALMSLARVKNKTIVRRERVLQSLSTPWAKVLAEAMMDEDKERALAPDQAEDLLNVRQLAGVKE